LRAGYAAKAYLLAQIEASASDVLAVIVATVHQTVPLRFIGPRTVSYRVLHATDDADASACLVTFYERVTWLGFIAPTSLGEASRRERP
jgi:alpha-D-ribose 1-methylphosphonate 5-phosphate C-P lyase